MVCIMALFGTRTALHLHEINKPKVTIKSHYKCATVISDDSFNPHIKVTCIILNKS